jgi:3-dehydroquinate dehydratase-1
VKVIASHHDFEQTPAPEVMQMILEQMCAGGADIVKLAVMPQDRQDVLDLISVTTDFHEENSDTPVITMAMGALGVISRICGEIFGSCVTFACHNKPSAPGQLEMNKLNDILDALHESSGDISNYVN